MPLNLDSQTDGEYLTKLLFHAGAGFWHYKKDGEETRIKEDFKACFDMGNLQTGFSKYNGSFVEFIADPSLEHPAPQPEAGADGEAWKRAFKVTLMSKTLGGKMAFLHNARNVTGAFNELYCDYETAKKKGQSPVVEIKADGSKSGDFYRPNWKIVNWVDTPKEFSEQPQQAQPATDDDDDF